MNNLNSTTVFTARPYYLSEAPSSAKLTEVSVDRVIESRCTPAYVRASVQRGDAYACSGDGVGGVGGVW